MHRPIHLQAPPYASPSSFCEAFVFGTPLAFSGNNLVTKLKPTATKKMTSQNSCPQRILYFTPIAYNVVDAAGATALSPDCNARDNAFSVPNDSCDGEMSLSASCTPAASS